MKWNSVIKTSQYKVAIAILLIGFGSGLFSFLLHESVVKVSSIIGTDKVFSLSTTIVSILFALTSLYLTKFLFKDTNGSGIPQVKLSLVAYKGRMPKRMPLGKFVTSFLTLCSGLSFGKEGPMVTISAAWAHLVSFFLNLNRQLTKVLVSSGATAGLAAAFNTPIAAVVFTIEEVLGQLNTKYLGPIVLTSVLASVTSYKLLGNHATFIPLHYKFHIEWHLILYLGLGLIMSAVGYSLVKVIIFFKRIKQNYFLKIDFVFVILAVLLTALFSLYNPQVLGDGVETINSLLQGHASHFVTGMVILFLIKFVLICTSYSTGLSGGIFMPVLFLGALGGGIYGLCLQKLGINGIEVGAFALLGMTSLLVAVIRTPFTAFVMLFEMTRDYELILPLMISSIAAYWISTRISSESVYESVAEYEGVHLPTQADNECLNDMVVEDCMAKEVLTLDADSYVKDIVDSVRQTDFSGFPVLRNKKLIGVINRAEVLEAFEDDPEKKLHDATKYSVISIYPDQSLLVALDKMKRFEIGRLPVVSRFNDKQLLGLITPEDIVNHLGLSRQFGD